MTKTSKVKKQFIDNLYKRFGVDETIAILDILLDKLGIDLDEHLLDKPLAEQLKEVTKLLAKQKFELQTVNQD